MFRNIGAKIKTLAIIFFVGEVILSFIAAVAVGQEERDPLAAMIVLITGCLVAWIANFFVYGFGQLIVHMKNVDEKLSGINLTKKTISKKDQIKQWLDEGLVSEDEYNNILFADNEWNTNMVSAAEELQKLKALFETNQISEEEYTQGKAIVLNLK